MPANLAADASAEAIATPVLSPDSRMRCKSIYWPAQAGFLYAAVSVGTPPAPRMLAGLSVHSGGRSADSYKGLKGVLYDRISPRQHTGQ